MRWLFFEILPKKFLGIDIGTSFIKVIELSRWGERRKLENYGEIKAPIFYEKSSRTFEKSTLLLSNREIAWAIKAIIQESGIKTHQAVLSIPDFSSFFTNFELPLMTKEELLQAVRYEARLHVPLPLNEVILDWIVIGGKELNKKKEKRDASREKLKILLVAVPNEVINQYREIANLAGLQLFALEAETFGLLRSLIGEESKEQVLILLEIGARSTTCSIIDKGILKTSYSFDMAGNELTEVIAKSLSIDYKIAEEFKKNYGLLPIQEPGLGAEKNIKEILAPLIDIILIEVNKISENFEQRERKKIQKIIIAGGTALIPGLLEYFQNYFGEEIEIEIANPFSDIFCPPILENTLKNMGPSYAISVGAALRGLE